MAALLIRVKIPCQFYPGEIDEAGGPCEASRMDLPLPSWTLFVGERRAAAGAPAEVALAASAAAADASEGPVLVFDDATGRVVDLDLRGAPAEVAARYAPAPRRRGRPKLGVEAREVTLLPRHWDWLTAQPGGASVALRKLVEQARRDAGGAGERKARHEAAYRFMTSMAGDLPGYEAAIRALFADDRPAFDGRVAEWPVDVAAHAARLAWG
jgi:hypothetical protein